MSINELGKILGSMYKSTPDNEKATYIHLFGIKYDDIILRNKYSSSEIVKSAGIKESYKAEVKKGVNLSKYVIFKA
ncbi:HTH-like domain-containing protein [Halalkalibacterium halodurans]|uniref:HTH-like domain-containing protein n=1 Tax=Halalkalibacterium halodurans TaxID=86665 RepID=A0A0M0KDP7_ALKHA|nr:hypothetical protein [Halalkalibacterium halodurans]TPE65939.1 hypothetical protein AMD02_019805 [Halalkalibacterium halodurans]